MVSIQPTQQQIQQWLQQEKEQMESQDANMQYKTLRTQVDSLQAGDTEGAGQAVAGLKGLHDSMTAGLPNMTAGDAAAAGKTIGQLGTIEAGGMTFNEAAQNNRLPEYVQGVAADPATFQTQLAKVDVPS